MPVTYTPVPNQSEQPGRIRRLIAYIAAAGSLISPRVMPDIKLRKFDMGQVADDAVVMMLGKRGVGKSFLVRDLLSHKKHIPAGVVVSGTEAANGFYSKIFPPIFLHDNYSPSIVSNLLKRQKKLVGGAQNGAVDARCLLIMDDCLYDNTWTRDANMRSVFMNGRHWKIMMIITSQYPLGIPPNLRTNIDYVFILRENFVSNRRRIYENYCGMLPTFEAFCAVLDQTTENFECLVVNNTTRSNRIDDQLFYYKAEEPPDFTIGAPVYWQANDEYMIDGDETYDDTAVVAARGGSLRIRKM